MKQILVGILLAFALSGGLSAASKPDKPNAEDHGAELTDGYTDAIQRGMKFVLKDPDSAKYEFQPPYKSFLKTSGFLMKNKGTIYSYTVPVLVNAKNGIGGYTGFRKYKFFFRDNQILGWSDEKGIWRDLRPTGR